MGAKLSAISINIRASKAGSTARKALDRLFVEGASLDSDKDKEQIRQAIVAVRQFSHVMSEITKIFP